MGNTPSTGNVIIYTAPQFGGQKLLLGVGTYKKLRLDILDFDLNNLASFKVGPRTVIEFFEHDFFKGQMWIVRNEQPIESKDLAGMGTIGPVGSIKIHLLTDYVPSKPDMTPLPEPEIVSLKAEIEVEKEKKQKKRSKDIIIKKVQTGKNDVEENMDIITKQPVPVLHGLTTMEEQEEQIRIINKPPIHPNPAELIKNQLPGATLEEAHVELPTSYQRMKILNPQKDITETIEIDGSCVSDAIENEISQENMKDPNFYKNIKDQCSYKLRVLSCGQDKERANEFHLMPKPDETKSMTIENNNNPVKEEKVRNQKKEQVEGFAFVCYNNGVFHLTLSLIIIILIFYLVTKLKD